MKDEITTYGKYAATAVVGIGVGVTGYAVTDTPTKETNTYQNLQNNLTQAQADSQEFEEQVADLQTTVTDKEERVATLESQVTQFNETVKQLREENADLEDAVAQAQERTGLVDYLPVFDNEEVELYTTTAYVDQSAEEGEYDRINAFYEDDYEGHTYNLDVRQYEESEDAEDRVDEVKDEIQPVTFNVDGDKHTTGVTVKDAAKGSFDKLRVEYDDNVVEDVDHVDDVESVTVDGNDITDRVDSVANDGSNLNIHLDGTYQLNKGDDVEVTYSDADNVDHPTDVVLNGVNYNYEDNQYEFIYRDGNTVVKGSATEDTSGDGFDADYADFQAQYE